MRRSVFLLVAVALVVSACSSAAEKLAEAAVEAETGGQIDVSGNGDSFTIESEDGDGSVQVNAGDDSIEVSGTNEEGQDVTLNMGATDVPADFPMPIFDAGEVTNASTIEVGGDTTYTVTLEIDSSDSTAALEFYEAWMNGEGMEVMASTDTIVGQNDSAYVILEVDDYGDYSEVVMTWTPAS